MTFFLYYDVVFPQKIFWNLGPPLFTGRLPPLAPLCTIAIYSNLQSLAMKCQNLRSDPSHFDIFTAFRREKQLAKEHCSLLFFSINQLGLLAIKAGKSKLCNDNNQKPVLL